MATETLLVTRGIEKGSTRIEAGNKRARGSLEQTFGKKVVKHWISTGTLIKVKGGADAGKE